MCVGGSRAGVEGGFSSGRCSCFAGGPSGSHDFNMKSSFAMALIPCLNGGGFHSERAAASLR